MVGMYRGHRRWGAIVEPLALLLAAVTAVLWWGEGARFWLTIVGVVLLLLMHLVFPLVTERCNRQIARWSEQQPPEGWRTVIRRWELSHTVRAALMIAAAVLLAAAAIV